MQRIDENTYIDDTLVTCAEYQLFIDEMREQGKYYQPDHWTSYQFSEGKAREPILGVRHSDAVAFCLWLTSREESAWRYRIPLDEEAKQIPMKILGDKPSGYWILGTENNQYQFTWIGNAPVHLQDFTHDLIRAQGIAQDLEDNTPRYSKGVKIFNTNTVARNNAFARAINTNYSRAINIDHATNIDYSRNLTIKHSIDHYLDLILMQINVRDPDLMVENYVDLLTLQERIAGRSPAFEGIRLVKDRIR